jgi:hypothetical protein
LNSLKAGGRSEISKAVSGSGGFMVTTVNRYIGKRYVGKSNLRSGFTNYD